MKLVFDEPGSELAAELWDRAEAVVSSQLVYPEARAALAAAHRRGRVDADTLRMAVDAVDALFTQLSIVGLDPDLAHSAGDLAEMHGLRGYDAVHLATALGVNAESLLVATWDRELARGAIESGCSVSPPTTT